MKLYIYNYLIGIICFGGICYGQISPGKLSQAHSNIEGMSKCTQCHELGEKVTNSKCLECHKEIESLIGQNSGYHASSQVVNKDCFECHSEHHGRKFDMVRFDKENFNHNLTGYELVGKHGTVDCRECHKPDYISDSKIRQRKKTFLGLDEKCLSCHDDFHQNTLSNDCLSCHVMDGFLPVTKFNHDEAEFKLKGEHVNVDCIECHKKTIRKGKEFQEFTDIPFTDCKSCHDDPHNNQLTGTCTQCHVETSFSVFTGKGNFNHNKTGFRLKGEHKKINCFSCHSKTSNPVAVFQDNITITENSCIECHEDQHEGKYGNDCAKCHNEKSFLTLNNMDFFDHTITDYPLEGKHLNVDCKKCHENRFSTPINFALCMNCHDDYHREEFKENGLSPDCVECHSLKNGFEFSLYTLEQHQESPFPLEGAHVATPCFSCHVSEDDNRWSFRNLGSDCIDCHQDFHEGFITESFYPEDNCTLCHINDTWNVVDFDHSKTNWSLEGKHLEVDCRQCHFEMSENNIVISQKFINLETDCANCHANVHDDIFAIDGITDCNRCHITSNWFPKKFNHNTTAFPLEGRHAEIECSSCHEVLDESGNIVVEYLINKFECIDCHQ